MAKVNIENLIYKKPDLNFELGLLGRVHYEPGIDDGEGEEELPLEPTNPDNPKIPNPGDGSGNTGTGGQ